MPAQYLNTSGIIGAAMYAAEPRATDRDCRADVDDGWRLDCDGCRSTCSTRPTSCSAPTSRRVRSASIRDGSPVNATVGVIENALYLLRDEGVTHLGCASDHVIESWRNAR